MESRVALNPDFRGELLHGLSDASSAVFLVAGVLMAARWISAVILATATKARTGRH
ncbi:hypothetical protein MSIMFB_02720 [Mycobacterium simulans]|uniref:Uncharacterized protein n=1 Tax=Mycobacterium simulans TaxID=627089 RepID=A0A7Z7IMS5_9MYCO|nr:hypothetical protein MSIMFB_02720 [Mycobacterium simulans]